MSHAARVLLFAATALGSASLAGAGLAEERATEVDSVTVTANRINAPVASVVSGLNLTLRETPQSVTVIQRTQIDDFALNTVNDLLDQVTGVNVQRVETDRTQYDARGFDITNFQVDGIGLPLFSGLQFGDLDTVLFDRVEVVRGADGMMTGTGNPSATINYVRKRPTDALHAYGSLEYGSWNDKRLEADVSGPLNAAHTLTGRLVYANEDHGSYLDHYRVNRNVYYGVLAWDATPKLKFTLGYSQQDNRAKGVLWGALPLNYSDGSFIDFPVSASTSADWTFWNTRDQTAFAEAAYRFDNGWQARAVLTYKRNDQLAKLLYAMGYPDPVTGLGVTGSSGIYPTHVEQELADVYASGPLRLFGRTHELVVGAEVAQNHSREYENFSEDPIDYPAVGDWGRVQVADPTYPGAYLAADQTDRMYRIYAATHLDLTDRLKATIGFNAVNLTSRGYSYGIATPRGETAVSPYAGFVFDLTRNLSLYASYTDIFNPQSEVDATHQTLPAAHGRSYEGGVKSEWFDKRLYASVTVFHSEQAGLADYAGDFPDGKSFYDGVDTFVTGYELEVAGRITDHWSVSGGWTQLTIEDAHHQATRPYLPRQSLKLSTTYAVPALRDLKLGAALRWQGDISVPDIVTIPQKAYAVADLMASIRLVDKVRLTVNLKNIGNQKYLGSLAWNQAYYAAPRSASVTLSWSY